VVAEAGREAAVEALQRAAADRRLRLDDSSDRVGAALIAENADQLQVVTAGISTRPDVGTAALVSAVVAVLGDRRQVGRWRLPRVLRAYGVLGDVHLDLRGVVVSEDVVEIRTVTFLGDVTVDVPERVEVELRGVDVLGESRAAALVRDPPDRHPR
jgi:hypothetical protein